MRSTLAPRDQKVWATDSPKGREVWLTSLGEKCGSQVLRSVDHRLAEREESVVHSPGRKSVTHRSRKGVDHRLRKGARAEGVNGAPGGRGRIRAGG